MTTKYEFFNSYMRENRSKDLEKDGAPLTFKAPSFDSKRLEYVTRSKGAIFAAFEVFC